MKTATAELEQRLDGKPLTLWHWHLLDRLHTCTVGTLLAYNALERSGWIHVDAEAKAVDYQPLVESLARLQRLTTETLRDLALDRAVEPVDIWASIRNAQAAAAASDAADGQEGDQGPEDAADAKPSDSVADASPGDGLPRKWLGIAGETGEPPADGEETGQ